MIPYLFSILILVGLYFVTRVTSNLLPAYKKGPKTKATKEETYDSSSPKFKFGPRDLAEIVVSHILDETKEEELIVQDPGQGMHVYRWKGCGRRYYVPNGFIESGTSYELIFENEYDKIKHINKIK